MDSAHVIAGRLKAGNTMHRRHHARRARAGLDVLEAYRAALEIRLFEEKVDWLFSRGLIGGTTHLCIGQEAVAVGVAAALRPEDYVVSNHRGHGHLIARGAELEKLFAELLGKRGGYCMGRGGTQHVCAPELNFLGTNGITGGGIPIATGAGLSIKLGGEGRISVCFFGDGASNQGVFHESLNMASVWGLPVLYVCENNMYGMSTSFASVSRFEDVALRAASFGMPSAIVDGMDAVKVHEAACRLSESVRSGAPALLEAKTYRFCGHSKSDARAYRSRDEEAEWRRRDPLLLLEQEALRAGAGGELKQIRQESVAKVEEAYLAAAAGDEQSAAEAIKGAYAHGQDLIP